MPQCVNKTLVRTRAQPVTDHLQLRELAEGDYVAKAEPVLLIGEAGTGKTHVSTCIHSDAGSEAEGKEAWSALLVTSRSDRGWGPAPVLSGLAPHPWSASAGFGIEPVLTMWRTGMRCLECGSEAVTERRECTAQGYL